MVQILLCKSGHIYLYTGNGGGKTTNALGLALRTLGHGQRVLIVQFMKWNKETGEYLFKHPNYEIYQFGREGWKGEKNLNREDRKLAHKALFYAYSQRCKNYDLIVFDEVNLAVHCGLLTNTEVMKVVEKLKDSGANIVMTGRYASRSLIKFADFVNEVKEIKSPSKMVCEEGIQW